MRTTVTLEIPAEREALVRRLLALQEEVEQLALTAADGTVIDVCEAAVLQKGRELNTTILAEAVARRVEAAEKKGRRSAAVAAAGPRKTAARPPASS
jgi:hypothetical protein